MIAITIATRSYMPKVRILYKSFIKYNPGIKFICISLDRINNEEFSIIYWKDIVKKYIPNIDKWSFKYNIIELSTAIKPICLKYFLNKNNTVFYLDPDLEFFNVLPLNEFSGDINLTLHRGIPEDPDKGINDVILNNCGIFNLGFTCIKNTLNSIKFLDWWFDRLYNYSYNCRIRNLFTDQKWCDFVPYYFKNVNILAPHISGLNISTWNMSCFDSLKKNENNDIIFYANNKTIPLIFYHWSGTTSSINNPHKWCINNYSKNSLKGEGLTLLLEMHQNYIDNLNREELTICNDSLKQYSDGSTILDSERRLYTELSKDTSVERDIGNPYKYFNQWLYKNYGPVKSAAALNIKFDSDSYAMNYPDAIEYAGLDRDKLLFHYITIGYKLGYKIT